MKNAILLFGLAILSTGCTRQFITVSQRPQVQYVDVQDSFTIVRLTDGRMIRIRPNDMLVVSDQHPQGIVKRYESLWGKNKEIPLDIFQCNRKQYIDCYLSEEMLTQRYTDDVMETFYRLGRK